MFGRLFSFIPTNKQTNKQTSLGDVPPRQHGHVHAGTTGRMFQEAAILTSVSQEPHQGNCRIRCGPLWVALSVLVPVRQLGSAPCVHLCLHSVAVEQVAEPASFQRRFGNRTQQSRPVCSLWRTRALNALPNRSKGDGTTLTATDISAAGRRSKLTAAVRRLAQSQSVWPSAGRGNRRRVAEPEKGAGTALAATQLLNGRPIDTPRALLIGRWLSMPPA